MPAIPVVASVGKVEGASSTSRFYDNLATFTKPTTLRDDDLLLFFGGGDASVLWVPNDTGWNKMDVVPSWDYSTVIGTSMWWRLVTDSGNEPSEYSFYRGEPKDEYAAILYQITGASTVDPFLTGDLIRLTSGTAKTYPAVKTVVDNALLIRVCMCDDDNNIDGSHPPTDHTDDQTFTVADSAGPTVFSCHTGVENSGDQAAASWTVAGSEESVAYTIAIAPVGFGRSITTTTQNVSGIAKQGRMVDGSNQFTVIGEGFGGSKTGPAKIELTDIADYGAATKVDQTTIAVWADTVVQITPDRSTIDTGWRYVWVTNSGGDLMGPAEVLLTDSVPLVDVRTWQGTFVTETNASNITEIGDIPFRPKALQVFGTRATGSNQVGGRNVAVYSSSFNDENTGFCLGVVQEGESQPDGERGVEHDNCCILLYPDTAGNTPGVNPGCVGYIDSFTDTGFTISYASVDTNSGFLMQYVAYGGADFKCKVGIATSDLSIETGLGFYPDVVQVITVIDGTVDANIPSYDNVHYLYTYGVGGHPQGDKTAKYPHMNQWSQSIYGGQTQTSNDDRHCILSPQVASCIFTSAITCFLKLDRFNYDSFSYSSDINTAYFYLAMDIGGPYGGVDIDVIEKPFSITDYTHTISSPDFTGQLVCLAQSHDSWNLGEYNINRINATTGDNYAFGFGNHNGIQGSVGQYFGDNINEASSTLHTGRIGGHNAVASIGEFDVTYQLRDLTGSNIQIDIQNSSADSSPYGLGYWVIASGTVDTGEVAPVGPTIPILSNYYHMQRNK